MKKMSKKGFTLAEVMIVFVVVSILAAILIPALFRNSPDRYKWKARKAYHTLNSSVQYLTNSGPYKDKGGNLDATPFITDSDLRKRFFCINLAEAVNAKNVNCKDYEDEIDNIINTNAVSICSFENEKAEADKNHTLCLKEDDETEFKIDTLQNEFDSVCEKVYKNESENSSPIYNLQTQDGIYWLIQKTDFANYSTITVNNVSMPSFYNVVCINTSNSADANYIYGAGIRRDGKVLAGKKLQELIEDTDSDIRGR